MKKFLAITVLCAFVLSSILPKTGFADPCVWSGGGVGPEWQDAGNWDTVPDASRNDDLTFTTTLFPTNDNDFPDLTQFKSITFTGVDAFTLEGFRITLAGDITDNSTASQTINLSIMMGTDMAIDTVNAANTTTIGGNISTTDALLASHTLTVQGNGSAVIGGVIGGDGDLVLNANANSTLTLSNINVYTGGTTITSGTIIAGADYALGGGNIDVTATGGALDLNGVNYSATNALSLIGTGVGSAGALTNSSGTAATYGGVVTLGAGGASIGGAGDITLSQGLGTSATTLTKVGANTLTLSSASSRTGDTDIDVGTIKVGADGAMGTAAGVVTVADGAVLDLNGVNYATGSALTINGAGIAGDPKGSLTNSSNTTAATYGGVVTLGAASSIGGAGNINLSQGLGDDGVTAFALTKSGAGSLILNGASTRSGATTINAGSTIQVHNAAALGTGNLTNNGTLTLGTTQLNIGGGQYSQNNGSTLNITASSSGSGSITSTVATGVSAGTSTINVTVDGFVSNGSYTVVNTNGAGINFPAPTINVIGNYVTFSGATVGGNYVLTASRGQNGFNSVVANNPNPNLGPVASTFDNLTASNSTASMLVAANNVSTASQASLPNILNSMTVPKDGSNLQSQQQVVTLQTNNIADHMFQAFQNRNTRSTESTSQTTSIVSTTGTEVRAAQEKAAAEAKAAADAKAAAEAKAKAEAEAKAAADAKTAADAKAAADATAAQGKFDSDAARKNAKTEFDEAWNKAVAEDKAAIAKYEAEAKLLRRNLRMTPPHCRLRWMNCKRSLMLPMEYMIGPLRLPRISIGPPLPLSTLESTQKPKLIETIQLSKIKTALKMPPKKNMKPK